MSGVDSAVLPLWPFSLFGAAYQSGFVQLAVPPDNYVASCGGLVAQPFSATAAKGLNAAASAPIGLCLRKDRPLTSAAAAAAALGGGKPPPQRPARVSKTLRVSFLPVEVARNGRRGQPLFTQTECLFLCVAGLLKSPRFNRDKPADGIIFRWRNQRIRSCISVRRRHEPSRSLHL